MLKRIRSLFDYSEIIMMIGGGNLERGNSEKIKTCAKDRVRGFLDFVVK